MLQDQDLVAIQEVRSKVEAAHAAWEKFRRFSQDQVDAVVEAAAVAARAQALELAEMAVEETGYGNARDKLAKNLLNADFLPRAMRGMRTVGLLREIPDKKVVEYGVPVGVVAAIVPTTNPTSTVIFKTLISLKAGNGIVLSPHPRAKKCSGYTAELLAASAREVGAPDGLIQCLSNVTQESTQALMKHPKTGIILATGGHGLVRAAYSSGKPAYGVGPGNVPVLLEKSADVAEAVAQVVTGKSFDFGTVCSSEQALVTCRALRDQVLAELKKQRAYICTREQGEALGRLLITPHGLVDPKCVGQAPGKIARMAGFEVPPDASILAVEVAGVGKEHPLSSEKLSPVLSLFFVEDFQAAMNTCEAILRFGGLGHTCVIFSKDEARIREFAFRMPAYRVLVNTPAPQGSVGLTTNVFPSMTLGCGAVAGNITSDNVGPQHLINIKRLAYAVRRAEDAITIPEVKSSAAPAPSPSSAPGPSNVPRELIEAAVEKYLSERGLSRREPPAPPPVTASALAGVAEQVVDLFLSSRARNSGPAPSCPIPAAGRQSAPEVAAESGARPNQVSGQAEVRISDFVCENDVREAIAQSRKIYIGPRTIVTPSARELAAHGDILVLAQRS
ncbi:MAG: aldehyde dehydrogenase family protein [Bryobacteraceae bacterium]|nr:aldehyde dehydrogenase family protein [Bryobacteraceae bacterium]